MSEAAIRGWCPTAWRPMAAGDGLLVRIRPRLARLDRAAVLGLCDVALTYGNGAIDVTNRANLQIRGVAQAGWEPLLERLCALGLIDADPLAEARRAVLVAPDWRESDDTHRIASELGDRLADLPDLPGKVGFAIDAGAAPQLRGDPADFRIERSEGGQLLLRADGRGNGAMLTPGAEVDALIALAHWFVATGGATAGRMARHTAALPAWADGTALPASPLAVLRPGRHALGTACGLPFGRIDARDLAALVRDDVAHAIRLTPWRMLIIEGGAPLATPEDDATLHTDACVGAPACPQATVETRALARRLAPLVGGRLHVSGCAKGCARARPADVVVTGRGGRFDLAFAARAGAPAVRSGLAPRELLAHFGAD